MATDRYGDGARCQRSSGGRLVVQRAGGARCCASPISTRACTQPQKRRERSAPGCCLLAAGIHALDVAILLRALAGFAFFVLTAPLSAHLLAIKAARIRLATG